MSEYHLVVKYPFRLTTGQFYNPTCSRSDTLPEGLYSVLFFTLPLI